MVKADSNVCCVCMLSALFDSPFLTTIQFPRCALNTPSTMSMDYWHNGFIRGEVCTRYLTLTSADVVGDQQWQIEFDEDPDRLTESQVDAFPVNPLSRMAEIIANDLESANNVSKVFSHNLDVAIELRDYQNSTHVPSNASEESYQKKFQGHLYIVDILEQIRTIIDEGIKRHRIIRGPVKKLKPNPLDLGGATYGFSLLHLHGSNASTSPRTPKSDSPMHGSSKSDSHQLALASPLRNEAQNAPQSAVNITAHLEPTERVDAVTSENFDTEIMEKVNKFLSSQIRFRNDNPQVWDAFTSGEYSVLAAGLATSLSYHLTDNAVAMFILLIADATSHGEPRFFVRHRADTGILRTVHHQHQHHVQLNTGHEGERKTSPTHFMPETAQYMFQWEADDQTRAHSSDFSQSFVSYGTPLFVDDGANEKVSIRDESYMYLWKKRNAQAFLCGVPSLNPESIVDPLTRAVSISLKGGPLSNSVPMNMSTHLDAQRQLGSKAACPYQLLLQVAAAIKCPIEKWFSTMGETSVSGVRETGATVNYVPDASNARHLETNPSLCAIMHFDILYSMRQVAIEAECLFSYTRLATLLWKRVQYVLPRTRVTLSWPDVEAVLRKQTIKLMPGKIAPHATAKDFAEAFLSILNHSQDEDRCLFLPSTLLKLTRGR